MADPKDFFADLLGTIEGEQERQAILATLTKDAKGKELVARINKLATDGENYNTWYKSEWPTYQRAHQTLSTVQKELETANKTIIELKAGKGAPGAPGEHTPPPQEEFDMESMTQEQLNKLLDDRIKAMGFVSKADAETIAETKAREAAAGVTTKVYGHAMPMVEAKLELRRKYEQDFPGKQFDNPAFDKFLGDNPNKFTTMGDAFAAFTRSDYENKTKADAFEQGRLAGEKTATEKLQREHADLAARGLPVDMGGGSGLPIMPGTPPPEPVELEKIDQNYDLGRRGGFRLAAGVAAKVKQDRAAGKQL